jgi:hypothetical protein
MFTIPDNTRGAAGFWAADGFGMEGQK